MSGFVVAVGADNTNDVHRMFEKIVHRGPFVSGLSVNGQTTMAQNYLEADLNDPVTQNSIPYSSGDNNTLKVCYDGQMGNWKERASERSLEDGPFREERLLLELYEQFGDTMAEHLDDAIFSFVISDGRDIYAARDVFGIKTLFYGWKDSNLIFASELKSLTEITDDVYEFPAGHFMKGNGKLIQFAELPKDPPDVFESDLDNIVKTLRGLILQSVRNRIDFKRHTACLLSGGMDSSVISYLANELWKNQVGNDGKLKTFALGVGESSDIKSARIMADHIGTDHIEVIVSLQDILDALPEVIYYLESFDPSLVRSSVSNYLISKRAKEYGVRVLLSGEGGDEIFCGYNHLKSLPPDRLFQGQMECLGYLHNNASLRLDRMNHCNSIRVVAPLVSGELFRYILSVPPEYKVRTVGDEKIEKWIFRKAYEPFLPKTITWRLKQEFSQGSGSAAVLPDYFESLVSDEDLAKTKAEYPFIRSKEEHWYFTLFRRHYPSDQAIATVGQWVSL